MPNKRGRSRKHPESPKKKKGRVDRAKADDFATAKALQTDGLEFYHQLRLLKEGQHPFQEVKFAFCCAKCKCPPRNKDDDDARKKGELLDELNNDLIANCDGDLWHRKCCHKGQSFDVDWCSDFQKALEEVLVGSNKNSSVNAETEQSRKTLEQSLKTLRKKEIHEESENNNWVKSQLEHQQESLVASELVSQHLVNQKRRGRKKHITVVDTFGGVGTGLVVLKRLGVGIKKIIHVEHDMVAKHIVRYNHDCAWWKDEEESDDETIRNSKQGKEKNKGEHVIGIDEKIQHIFDYQTFEEMERDIDSLMEKHGPIDVLLASPPRPVVTNDEDENVQADQQYLIRLCQFKNKIENHPLQGHGNPLFFLIELTSSSAVSVNERQNAEETFYSLLTTASGPNYLNKEPIVMDDMYFSPCRRLRYYFTNIVEKQLEISNSKTKVMKRNKMNKERNVITNLNINFLMKQARKISPETCLEKEVVEKDGDDNKDDEEDAKSKDGNDDNNKNPWRLPGELLFENDASAAQDMQLLKANIFTTTSNSLSSSMSFVVKRQQEHKSKNQYTLRPFSILERERMMGYPKDYITAPIALLFNTILKNAFMVDTEYLASKISWESCLRGKYHCFAGECYKFDPLGFHDDGTPHIKLKMSPPQPYRPLPAAASTPGERNSSTKQYFNEDEYAKRLIGNAYSVAVVELLLQPLTEIFGRRIYDGYNYKYFWENSGVTTSSSGPTASTVANLDSEVSDASDADDDEYFDTSSGHSGDKDSELIVRADANSDATVDSNDSDDSDIDLDENPSDGYADSDSDFHTEADPGSDSDSAQQPTEGDHSTASTLSVAGFMEDSAAASIGDSKHSGADFGASSRVNPASTNDTHNVFVDENSNEGFENKTLEVRLRYNYHGRNCKEGVFLDWTLANYSMKAARF